MKKIKDKMTRAFLTLLPTMLLLAFSSHLLAQTTPLESPPTGFCQTKTDYDATATCSSFVFMADTQSELDSYLEDFGLSGGQYENLRIRFALGGTDKIIHSPCEISFRGAFSHSAHNICLDGKKGVDIAKNSVFNSQKLHILSHNGDSTIHASANITVNELEIFSSKKIHLSRGVRLHVRDNARLVSTLVNTASRNIPIRFAGNSEITAGGLHIVGFGQINFLGRFVRVTNDLNVESKGTSIFRRLGVLAGSLSGNNVTLRGGNRFMALNHTTVTARGALHVEATGCDIARRAKLEGSSSSGSCLNEVNFNHVPTALATATPLTGLAPLSVTFSGSESTDSDGSIASYAWSFPDGTTQSGASVTKQFINPGAYNVRLTVTDNEGAMSEVVVMVTVTRPLSSPTASFTYSPTSGDIPLAVSFDGTTSTDPDGSLTSYEWIFSDGMTLAGSTAQRTFTEVGTYQVSLRVTDNDGLTHQTGQFAIAATQSNLPPVMGGNQSFSAKENMPFTLTLKAATDPESDPLTYTLVAMPSSGTLQGCLGGTNDLVCEFIPAADFTGTVSFSYRANDGVSDSAGTSMVTIRMAPYNKLPVANAGSDLSARFGGLVTLNGLQSSDPEGTALTYLWTLSGKPTGSQSQLSKADSAAPSLIVDKNGTYRVSLVVNDGTLSSPSDEVQITVTGETNQAPTLTAITSPQTLQVGQELRFLLEATDTDSHDQVVFSAVNLPANSRLDGSSGAFRFKPRPNQVGNHQMTFMAGDGKESSSQRVTITVSAPDTAQVTTLSSRVLDAKAYSIDGSLVPLAGVKVSVVGSSVPAVTSDAHGRFSISGIPHGPQTVSLDASGVTWADGSTFANFKGRLPIMPNVLNRPHRDYMLPRIDAAGTAMVTPASATTVSNTNIGVTLSVPANTAMNKDGTMYSGPLSVSRVPTNATPRELPEAFRPSFIITLQPVGIRFANPVPITFPNTDNLARNKRVPVYSLSEQGGFEQVAVGQVTSDGRNIRLVSGGIRATTWHFVSQFLPVQRGISTGDGGIDNSNNVMADPCLVGSFICAATGVLGENHRLASFKDLGVQVEHQLGFKNPSSLMKPTVSPLFEYVRAGGAGVNSIALPRQMAISFDFKGVQGTPSYFNLNTLSNAPQLSPFSLGQSLDTEGLSSGIYSIDSKLDLISGSTSNPSRRTTRNSFSLPVVSPDTEFGMGWRLEELHRLYGVEGQVSATSKKIMLVYGNFKYMVFEKNEDGSYTSPKGDYSTLTSVAAPFGGFIRTTKEGMSYVFNKSGFLVGKSDRYGRRTSYSYLANGKLLKITHPSGVLTAFAYGSDGLLETITDPAGRISRFEHEGKNLIRITDPDSSSRGFSYDQEHRLITQADKLGYATSYAYDSKGHVIRSIQPDGTEKRMRSQTTALVGEALGTQERPFEVGVDNPVGTFTDARGNSVELKTNEYGSVTERRDALGGTRRFARDTNNNITRFTDENGHIVYFSYDRYGNISSVFEGVTYSTVRTTSYRYMASPALNFHRPIAVIDAKGERMYFRYDAKGNVTADSRF